MKEILKESVYTGIGLAVLTAEKLQKEWENLKKEVDTQVKSSKKEGKKVVDDIVEDWDKRRDNLVKDITSRKNKLVEKVEDRIEVIEDKVKDTTEDLAEAVNLPTRKDLAKLTKSVEKLEAKVATQKPAAKTRAKRVTPAEKV
jgi:polyhydroxyalkanoate synthesis regulator phasin